MTFDARDIRSGDELFLNRVRVIQVSYHANSINQIQIEIDDGSPGARLVWISPPAIFDHIPQRDLVPGDKVLLRDDGMTWTVEHVAHHRAWICRADADEHELSALTDLFLLLEGAE